MSTEEYNKEFDKALKINEAIFNIVIGERDFYIEEVQLLQKILRTQQDAINKLYNKVYELKEKEKQLKEVISFE